MAITLIVFAVVLAIIIGSYLLFVVLAERQHDRALRARLRGEPTTTRLTDSVVKTRERLSAVRLMDAALMRWSAVVTPLGGLVTRSGLRVTVGTVVLAAVFLAVTAIAITAVLAPWGSLMLVAGAGAGLVPILYLRRAAAKRVERFDEQFPEAIDLIARALRAGHALPTALRMVGEEVPNPVGSEFRLLFDQQNFGMSLPDALKAFGQRVPLIDAKFFVTAVLTQREMGGNLSEVLDRLAGVIRERFKVKRQVRALSAHGRITGVVLGLLPPAVAGVLFVVSPEHIRLLVDDPIGVNMVLAAVVLQVIGVLIIRRIVNVEF
ncbi:MAG: type II secretion system F family protein [Vicinamibacterales bacterium]